MPVGGNDLLREVEGKWPRLGVYLRRYIVPSIETTAQNAAVDTNALINPPAAPAAVNVKVAGEMAHITIDDPQKIQRGIQYHVELATEPGFLQPHVEHLGSSRGRFINLPTNDDSGTPHTWYARAYSQYQGSKPGPVTYYGGTAPVGFTMAGTTRLTPLPSRGSGTASTNGTQGASGLGKVLVRPVPGPKRAV